MNKNSSAVLALSLILGLAIGSSAQAASPSAKPSLAKKPAVAGAKAGKEGSATHEMSEAATGEGEEGTKKIAKATTSVIKKKPTPKASPKK
jgi:hypothetical protein